MFCDKSHASVTCQTLDKNKLKEQKEQKSSLKEVNMVNFNIS